MVKSNFLSSIFGGMVTTNNEFYYQQLLTYRTSNLRKPGITKTIHRLFYLSSAYFAFNPYIYSLVNFLERKGCLNKFVKYYEEDKIYFPDDWDVWPSEIEARVGLAQLKKYDKIITNRVNNAHKWIAKLKGDPSIKFLPDTNGATYSHCVAIVDTRNKWIEDYYKEGKQLGVLIEYSIPNMSAYKKYKQNVSAQQ